MGHFGYIWKSSCVKVELGGTPKVFKGEIMNISIQGSGSALERWKRQSHEMIFHYFLVVLAASESSICHLYHLSAQFTVSDSSNLIRSWKWCHILVDHDVQLELGSLVFPSSPVCYVIKKKTTLKLSEVGITGKKLNKNFWNPELVIQYGCPVYRQRVKAVHDVVWSGFSVVWLVILTVLCNFSL